MKPGDPVLVGNTRGVLLKLPQSKGRKRPRALVDLQGTEMRVPVDELKEIPDEAQ